MESQQTPEQSGNVMMSGSSNQSYVNNASFMIRRIDTDPLVGKIDSFLSSTKVSIVQDDSGEFKEKVEQIGLPLANKEGIMRICNIVSMRVNNHVAQGNYDMDHYWDFIARARKEITESVIKKCYDWEVDDSNINMIIDEICALIESFMTRPIGNLERDSYGQQFSSREVIKANEKKGGIMGLTGIRG